MKWKTWSYCILDWQFRKYQKTFQSSFYIESITSAQNLNQSRHQYPFSQSTWHATAKWWKCFSQTSTTITRLPQQYLTIPSVSEPSRSCEYIFAHYARKFLIFYIFSWIFWKLANWVLQLIWSKAKKELSRKGLEEVEIGVVWQGDFGTSHPWSLGKIIF